MGLSSSLHPDFPTAIHQAGIKRTTEPPKGHPVHPFTASLSPSCRLITGQVSGLWQLVLSSEQLIYPPEKLIENLAKGLVNLIITAAAAAVVAAAAAVRFLPAAHAMEKSVSAASQAARRKCYAYGLPHIPWVAKWFTAGQAALKFLQLAS